MTWTATEKTICVDSFKCYPVITAVSLSPYHKGGLAGEASAPLWYKYHTDDFIWSGSHGAPNVNFRVYVSLLRFPATSAGKLKYFI